MRTVTKTLLCNFKAEDWILPLRNQFPSPSSGRRCAVCLGEFEVPSLYVFDLMMHSEYFVLYSMLETKREDFLQDIIKPIPSRTVPNPADCSIVYLEEIHRMPADLIPFQKTKINSEKTDRLFPALQVTTFC